MHPCTCGESRSRALAVLLAIAVALHARSLDAAPAGAASPSDALRPAIPDPGCEWIVALNSAGDAPARARRRADLATRAAGLGLSIVAGFETPADRTNRMANDSPRAASAARFELDPERVFLLRGADALTARAAARRLADEPWVEWIEPNRVRTAADFPLDGSLPDDPLLREGRQWGLWNPGPAGPYRGTIGADIGAREAWSLSCGSSDLILAIADTGVDPAHPDLQRVMPDGSPRLIRGINVTLDGSRSWADSTVHGTAVAGVMAALTHDGPHFDSLGIAGVCGGDGRDNAGCRIVPIKIAPGHTSTASSFDLANGIAYAAQAGARVLNLSFAGSGPSELERRALAYALARGCVVVAAAGNLGVSAPTLAQYPAAYAADGLCIQVGASDPMDRRAMFSSYGPGLDLIAPGQDIWTTALTYPNAFGAHYGGYVSASGTSFAAPHVAGAAGLLLARRPELIDTDLQHVLRESAHDVGAPGVDVETGWGRLDAAAALCAVAPEIAIAHDERLAFTRPTGILAPLTVGADSFGTFDRGAWWTNRLAELVEAVVVIALPDSFGDSVRVWPHVWGTTTLRDGFHLAHFSPWAELAGREGRVVRLHGWLYRLPGAAAAARAAGAGWAIAKPTRGAGPDESDADDAWLPLPPDQARIAFTVIGPRRGPVPHIPDKSLEIPSSDPVIHAVPNPVRDHCVVSGPPGSRMVIVDLTGRAIRRTTLDPVRGRFDWDGRDAIGKRVPPGLYFLMAEGAPRNARSRISPLRLVVLD